MRWSMLAVPLFSLAWFLGSVDEVQAQISFGGRGFGISIGGPTYVGPHGYGNPYGYRGGVNVGVGIVAPSPTYYHHNGGGAQRRVVENPLPRVGAHLPIKIVRNDEFDAPLSYTLNDHEYKIRPGESQWLLNDRDWEIEFDRGGDFGLARYSMSPGIYTFKLTKQGWEIFHDDDLSKLSVTSESKGAKDNAPSPRPKDLE